MFHFARMCTFGEQTVIVLRSIIVAILSCRYYTFIFICRNTVRTKKKTTEKIYMLGFIVIFYSYFFYCSTYVLFSVIGAIQIRDADDDDSN